ncbi:glycine cleavage T C-terminal barrel domain-containing protein [Arthrobacter livingstonensis]|uniref:glycine cleavage T C-terminal barrel domain-containing protein n=1 Tax=Arthrobacter livingstonensis TaxID=670078 RepID=UPI001FE64867|nr:glycine cleavage T C-terminal barrel domain-containing protein [Arthrobacter livingstonensis]
MRQGAGQWAGRRPGPLHILGNGVALALVDPAVPLGRTLALDIRGRNLGVTVAEPPFVRVRVRA